MTDVEIERPTKRRRVSDHLVAQFLDLEASVDSDEDSDEESEEEGKFTCQCLLL